MGKGKRIISVMNRKGGCGKSTLVRGLASVAVDRGERVTVFDTDRNQGIYHWMVGAKNKSNWHEKANVIGTLDAIEVLDGIQKIYDGPDEDHLILIDTFGGGSVAQDEMAMTSHLLISPCRASDQDVRNTTETGIWHTQLKARVSNPEDVPPFHVIASDVPQKLSETTREQLQIMMDTLPVLEDFVLTRACYERMNNHGLLGIIRDTHPNRGLAPSLNDGIVEMGDLLDVFDEMIKEAE